MDSNSDKIDVVWGVKGIAPEIGRTERQTQYLIDTGAIPVKRFGRLIATTRTELRALFGAADVISSERPEPTAAAVSEQARPKLRGTGRPRKSAPPVMPSAEAPSAPAPSATLTEEVAP